MPYFCSNFLFLHKYTYRFSYTHVSEANITHLLRHEQKSMKQHRIFYIFIEKCIEFWHLDIQRIYIRRLESYVYV